MNEGLYKFCKRNFDFENKFPKFERVVQVFNDSRLSDKPHSTQRSTKFHFDKHQLKVTPFMCINYIECFSSTELKQLQRYICLSVFESEDLLTFISCYGLISDAGN